jgi:transcriptional regulator with XRE-family HTH domain
VDAQTQQVMARIAASLVRVQRSRGISTPRLARISKIDQSTLERILRGEDDLQVHTVFVLAAALGVTPVTLLQGIVWIPNAPDGGSFEIEEPDGA